MGLGNKLNMNRLEKIFKSNKPEEYLVKRYFDYFLLVISFAIAVYLGWSVTLTAAGLIVLYLFLNPPTGLFLAKSALLLLVLMAITLAVGQGGKAEKISMLVYPLLAVSVGMTIWEQRKRRSR